MHANAHTLFHQLVVADLGLVSALLLLVLPEKDLLFKSLNLVSKRFDVSTVLLVLAQLVLVLFDPRVRFRRVTVEFNFKFLIERVDLLDQLMLHTLKLLHVLVLGFLSCGLEVTLHLLLLKVLFFLDCGNHFLEFKSLLLMTAHDFVFLCVELTLDDVQVAFEFFMQA